MADEGLVDIIKRRRRWQPGTVVDESQASRGALNIGNAQDRSVTGAVVVHRGPFDEHRRCPVSRRGDLAPCRAPPRTRAWPDAGQRQERPALAEATSCIVEC